MWPGLVLVLLAFGQSSWALGGFHKGGQCVQMGDNLYPTDAIQVTRTVPKWGLGWVGRRCRSPH